MKARVNAGRLVVDEPTDLPDGTEVELLPLDPGDWLDESDRAALHEALRQSNADVAGGRLVDAEEVLESLRAGRALCWTLALVLASVTLGCGGKKESEPPAIAPPPANVGGQAALLINEARALREADAAIYDIVRAAGDCDTVNRMKDESQRKLEEVAQRVQTTGGRQQVEGLRRRLSTIVEGCIGVGDTPAAAPGAADPSEPQG